MKIAPRRIHRPATTMYAIPRKSFCPPMTVRVDNTMVFVPPYEVTGKSSSSAYVRKGRSTEININLVSSCLHDFVGVTKSKFTECWKTSSSHPDLKFVKRGQIGDGLCIRIPVRVLQYPIWWWFDLVIGIRGLPKSS